MGRSKIILVGIGVLLIGGAVFAWCWFNSHTSDVHLKYIPKEAAAVFSIHTRELATKIDPSKLEGLKPVTQTVNDIPDFLMNLMTDPFNTGIDPVQNIYGYMEKHAQSTASALVVAIDDESDFSVFVKKMFPERKAEEVGDFKYVDVDDTRALAWNDEAALFVAVDGMDVRAYTEGLFNQAEGASIQMNPEFMAFNEKTFDAGLFTDNKRLSSLNTEASSLSLIGMSEGNSQFMMRFEQNEIITEYIAPQQKAPLFKPQGPGAADLELLGMKDPLIFMGFNFDVKQLLASSSNDEAMSQNVEMMTAALGMSQEEMTQLFTGTVTAAVSDYQDIYNTDPRVQKEMKTLLGDNFDDGMASSFLSTVMSIEVPITAISLGITDEKKTNEMLLMIGMKPQDGGFWAAPGVELVVYAVVKSNHLVITNDYLTAEAIAKNGKLPGKLPADYAAKVPSQPFSLWMDFEKSHLPALLLAPENPILGTEDLASYVSLSDIFSSARYESSATGSTFRFTMPAGEENSLVRMIKYMSSAQ
jgi:hypothetical protein